MLARFRTIAAEQTEIWGDTILEDEFTAGRPRLDHVEAISRAGVLVAYRIVYSASAWRLDGHGTREAKGRIVEASLVSTSLESWVRDEDAFAGLDAEQTKRFQHRDGLAQRGAADAEVLRQFALRRQARTRRHQAIENGLLQTVRDATRHRDRLAGGGSWQFSCVWHCAVPFASPACVAATAPKVKAAP